MSYAFFAPLVGLYAPTLLYPTHNLPKPQMPFIPYGFNIPKVVQASKIKNPKAIVIFVGGFCDTIMCAVYRAFIAFDEPSCLKIYTSFKIQHLFTSWLVPLVQCKLPIFVIAHSWGASNFYKALQNLDSKNVSLEYLLTLDPVGYHLPHTRPIDIKLWENVYIANKWAYLRRPNIVALIGHPWNAIKVSDRNIIMHKPAHHASIMAMIEASGFHSEIHRIIRV
ncbi:hypothetical protein [uncultured Helicobacter sp.]|uniref:hypothetical protein n=1 Tax=uncultured Helicobacter sp. TaxID=175537 RepID=UPI0025D73400|nr:hypothetical protein [uncultured Helicobacter sp.]